MPIKPRAQITRSTTPKKAPMFILEPQIEIAVWCPDEQAKLPPEQVHLLVHWPAELADLPTLVIRFKGPDTLGFLIEELARYRRLVWPGSESVQGETVRSSE